MTAQPIVCFDLDGTLVDEHRHIHPRDLEILANPPQGVTLAITTGRIRHAVKAMFAECGLFTGQPLPFPMVLQNGAAIYAPHEQLLDFAAFQEPIQAALLAIVQHQARTPVLLSDEDSYHVLRANDFTQHAAVRFAIRMQSFTAESTGLRFGKVMAISDVPAELAELDALTEGLDVERFYSMPIIYEITPRGSDKGVGLTRLVERLGLSGSPVMVIGDGDNDLPLFALADRAYAPATAPENVRAQANRVIQRPERGILEPVLVELGVLVGGG